MLTRMVLVSMIAAALQAQAPANPFTGSAIESVAAVHVQRAPILDGRDDDPVWRTAPRYAAFRQFQPHVDAEPTFKTEFSVVYDARDLFVFVRMYDPHPDSILHALTRRDVRGPSDQIKVMIDSYDDRRSGYEFAVNPDGVKRDYSMSNDGNEDESWDGIWDVATHVDSLGWTAEFRIPLSQLRYAKQESNTFGFGVWRDIERFNERESWPLYNPKLNGVVSQLGRLTGLTGITTDRRVELTPYAVTKNVERSLADTRYARGQQVTAGGDLKFGITPNVTLDATVNPDFGQVEADPAVLNLTAFETFFAERRPFFVEGTGLYNFALNCYIVIDCSSHEGLFYSRRIGRYPSLRDTYGDSATPTATPIAAASKLTGRTESGLSFGVLDATTEMVRGANSQTVEPLTNYGVVRALQDFRGGESSVSMIATAVNRSLDSFTGPYLHRDAYTGGASFRNRFDRQEYELFAQIAASRVDGSPQAIALTQTSSVHYFQQAGAGLTLDSTRTSLNGDAEQIKFGKYGGGITRFETSVQHESPGFETNDIGYLRRADLMDWSTWAALSWRDATAVYRWLQVNGNHWETWNTNGTRLENAVNFNGHMGLNNNWDVHVGSTFAGLTPRYCDRCTRGGPLLRQSRAMYPWGGFNSDSRRAVSGGMWVNLSYADGGRSHGSNLSPYVNFILSPRFVVNVSTNYSRGEDNTQWYDNFTDSAGATHYAFAHLSDRTMSLGTRVNYTVTPNLTFEFYGAPFVASGTYSDVRETSATPRANDYDARFQPYALPAGNATSFDFTQLKTNAVLRWEYRPGSTLFVVWAHGRQDSESDDPHQTWVRDYRDLFTLHPTNTFLVKLSYWMTR